LQVVNGHSHDVLPLGSGFWRRLPGGLAARFFGAAGNVDVHGEFVDALIADLGSLDLHQPRILQIRRGLPISHERRHPRLRLGKAVDRHALPRLLDAFQIHAVRQLAYELIEQVHDFGTIRLQRFHDLLAGQQRCGLLLDLVDLLDLLVELDDLLAQVLVAVLLLGELLVEIGVHHEPHRDADGGDDAHGDEESLLLLLAADFAMRQQIDAYHGSNLRIASPQDTMSDGASWVRFFGRILDDSAMLVNGLATTVFTCVRLPTASSTPGRAAHPPESTR